MISGFRGYLGEKFIPMHERTQPGCYYRGVVDSFKLYEALKTADFSTPQAQALTEAIGFAIDAQQVHQAKTLATKADASALSSGMERLEAQFRASDQVATTSFARRPVARA
jgi:hypothetical protein